MTERKTTSPANARGSTGPTASDKANMTKPIIDAALRLLSERRAMDISMREIASSAGVAPSLVSYHFESKNQALAAACEAAGAAWRVYLEQLQRLAKHAAGPDQQSEVAAAWISAVAAARPDLTRIWGDLLLSARNEPFLRGVAQDWAAAWRENWAASFDCSSIVAEFAAFELIFAAPLAGAPDRNLIMGEALRRVFRRCGGISASAADRRWHTALCLDRMDPIPARAAQEQSVKSRIVDAAADIIAQEGAVAATHRAVAAKAGASLSSMTYHFETKAVLVREGLLRVFERAMTASAAAKQPAPLEAVAAEQWRLSARDAHGQPGARLSMVRAMTEVAQEASVDPSFRSVAMELRRIRGLVTRQSIAHALGLRSFSGADAADYAIWESGAALLRDAEPIASPKEGVGQIAAAMTLFFPSVVA